MPERICYNQKHEFVDIWPGVRSAVENDFWGRTRVDKLDWLYNFIHGNRLFTPSE